MMSRQRTYGLAAVALALGAPAGLLLLRLVRQGRWILGWVRSEFAGEAATYLYITVSTMVVFLLFGLVLGHAADRLVEQSVTDPLTGLRNRRFFHERLADEFARARRSTSPLSVVLLDVDRLKELNDQHGHGAGDRALRRAAAVIQHAARVTDVVARWGGDEFIVLAPDTDSTQAETLARRICLLASEDFEADATERRTLSAGVATMVASRHTSPERLLQAADQGLYAAKRAGRDRVALAP
jgi:diguanylate cyclase (GGDEF)-like protein